MLRILHFTHQPLHFVKGAGPVAAVFPVFCWMLHMLSGRMEGWGASSRAGAHDSSRVPWASCAPAPLRRNSPPHTTTNSVKSVGFHPRHLSFTPSTDNEYLSGLRVPVYVPISGKRTGSNWLACKSKWADWPESRPSRFSLGNRAEAPVAKIGRAHV